MKKTVFALLALASFAACKNAEPEKKTEAAAAPVVEAPAAATPIAPVGDCYLLTLKQDSSAVQIIMDGNKVSGYYDWRPWEKDGAHGILSGTKTGDMIIADYKYMIEGSVQTEEIMFKVGVDMLTKMEGELVDKNGKLVLKNPAKAKSGDILKKVDCKVIETNIGYSKMMVDMMK